MIGGVKMSGKQWVVQLLRVFMVGELLVFPFCSCEHHVFAITLTDPQGTSSTDCSKSLPETLQVDVANSSHPFPQTFQLYRKDDFNMDVPIYVMDSGHSGTVRMTQWTKEPDTTAAYQNRENGAAFLAACTNQKMDIAGTLYVEGVRYRVSRVDGETSSGALDTQHDYVFTLVNDTQCHDKIKRPPYRQEDNRFQRLADVTETASDQGESSGRVKRQTKEYYIDVLVILDYSFYDYWLNWVEGKNVSEAIWVAKQYVAYIFNGINTRYATINTTDFRIHITLSGFLIAQTQADSPWTETVKETVQSSGVTQVNAAKVLDNLEVYTKNNYNALPKHDHVMLFTEYDLYGNDNGFRFNNTAGFAFVGSMCGTDGRSVSVVEDHGGFQSEGTATHELGHSMGAKHDGTDNQCSSEDRYIMAGGIHAPTPSTKLNPWKFSQCTVQYFKDKFASLALNGFEATCLLNKVTPDKVPQITDYPGQLAGPDDQCRQIYGTSSYLCRGTKFGAPEEICLAMYCRNPSIGASCTLNTAAGGTCCGNGKWCINGKCVTASDAKYCYMSTTCPFGQRKGVVSQGLTCDQMAAGNCYNENFRLVCCEMCDKNRTQVVGCEYGDHVSNCQAAYCGRTLSTGELYDVQCCGTCNHAPTTGATVLTTLPPPDITQVPGLHDHCRDLILINGTETCAVFLNTMGSAYCYQPNIETNCCKSCRALKSSDLLCPYGDSANCAALQNKQTPCNSSQRQLCCKTCKDVDTRLGVTAPSPQAVTTTAATITDTAPTTTMAPTTPKPPVQCVEVLGVFTCGATPAFTTARGVMTLLLGGLLVVRVIVG